MYICTPHQFKKNYNLKKKKNVSLFFFVFRLFNSVLIMDEINIIIINHLSRNALAGGKGLRDRNALPQHRGMGAGPGEHREGVGAVGPQTAWGGQIRYIFICHNNIPY